MKSPRKALLLALLAAWGSNAPLRAADEPVVLLPPLIVEESRTKKARPWYYAEGPGFEVLSRCSENITEEFARSFYRANQLLQILVPPQFQAKLSVPQEILLYQNEMVKQLPPEMLREMTRINPGSVDFVFSPVWVVPNLTLRDSDLDATYTIVDERVFDGSAMRVAPEAVRHALESRTPPLPPWFIEGVMALYQRANQRSNSLELPPFFWVTQTETSLLRADAQHPRSLLPLADLFGAPASISGVIAPDTVAKPWRHQAALFIRWALDGKKATRRNAFFKFVEMASAAPASEAMFQECFGLDYADVQERLSDYLPQAVKLGLSVGAEKSFPRLKLAVRGATVAEIARIKGDWERLSVNHVRRQYPALTAKYLEQSRLTLLQPYERGERDPALLAVLGLSYCDAGEEKTARGFLEAAARAEINRPRVYLELAQLHYAEFLRDRGVPLTSLQVQEVLAPLRRARALSPPLPALYDLTARVLSRADRPPTAEELDWIAEGARLFPFNPTLVLQAATFHVRYGEKSTAAQLVERGREIAGDEIARSQFEQLGAALTRRTE
jgi:hypothetical protein